MSRRWARRVLRTVIDLAAIYAAWAIQFAASGNHWAAAITATAVGLYGLWCFYDGVGLEIDPPLLSEGCAMKMRNAWWTFTYHVASLRWRFGRWISKCDDCGKRFGLHDKKIDHIPF